MLTLDDVHRYRALYWEGGLVDALGDGDPLLRASVPLAASRFDGLPPVLAIGANTIRCATTRACTSNGFARPAGPRITGWERAGARLLARARNELQAARLHRTVGGFLLAPHA